MDHPETGYTVTPLMDVYKENIQSYLSLDKLKLIIVVIGDLQNKEMTGDTWYPTAPTSNLQDFLTYASNHKRRVHQFYFIGEFLQANVKHTVFVKLDSRYGEYFPEYANNFGRPLRLKKLTHVMTNSGELFADEIINRLTYESGFKQSQCQMSIY